LVLLKGKVIVLILIEDSLISVTYVPFTSKDYVKYRVLNYYSQT